MNQRKFKALLALIRLQFNDITGALVKLYTPGNRLYRLTVSTRRNEFGVARECLLWGGEELLYSGPLDDVRLRTILTRRGVCRVDVTDVRREARGIKTNPGLCLKDPTLCKKKGKCRWKCNAKPKAVSRTPEDQPCGGCE